MFSGTAVARTGGRPICIPNFCQDNDLFCSSYTIGQTFDYSFNWETVMLREIGYLKESHLMKLVCSQCLDNFAATVITVPGSHLCPSNWCLKYNGVLSAVDTDGDYICVNPNQEDTVEDDNESGGDENSDTSGETSVTDGFVEDPHHLSLVQANCFGPGCGVLSNRPLGLPCAVCSISNIHPCPPADDS